MQPSQEIDSKTTPSLKPFFIALVLIIVITAIYITKKEYFNKKDLAISEQNKQPEQETKTINIKNKSPEEVNQAINNEEYQLIDIRPTILFDFSHIESSINLPLPANNFSDIINKDKKNIVIDEQETDEGKLFVEKLSKSSYEAFYLEGGLKNYSQNSYGTISIGDIESDEDKSKVRFVSANEAQEKLKNGEKFDFLDVREKNDFQKYHIEGSVNIPLDQLEKNKKAIPSGKIIVVDDNYIRSFQAAVRLYDMHILSVYCLSENINELEKQNPSEEKSPEDNQKN